MNVCSWIFPCCLLLVSIVNARPQPAEVGTGLATRNARDKFPSKQLPEKLAMVLPLARPREKIMQLPIKMSAPVGVSSPLQLSKKHDPDLLEAMLFPIKMREHWHVAELFPIKMDD